MLPSSLGKVNLSLRNLLRNRIRLAHGESLTMCFNSGTKAAVVDVPFFFCLTPCAYHAYYPWPSVPRSPTYLALSQSLRRLLSCPVPFPCLPLPCLASTDQTPRRDQTDWNPHSPLFLFSIRHIGRYNAALAHVRAFSLLTPSSLY